MIQYILAPLGITDPLANGDSQKGYDIDPVIVPRVLKPTSDEI